MINGKKWKWKNGLTHRFLYQAGETNCKYCNDKTNVDGKKKLFWLSESKKKAPFMKNNTAR